MKWILLALSALLTAALVAQSPRGHWYLSGNTGAEYSAISSDLPESVYINQNPLQRLEGFRGESFRSGYFLTNRLLVGSRVDFRATAGSEFRREHKVLIFRPFVRYYLLEGLSAKTSFFGEVGFGTIGFGDVDRFETDFHLGIGAERHLAAGVLATANLNYDASASGLNYTTLTVGFNALPGQLSGSPTGNPLGAGSFSAAGELLRAAYGRQRTGEHLEDEFTLDLSPRLGYFLLNGLMIEAAVNLTYGALHAEYPDAPHRGGNARTTDLDARLQFRYYLLQRGRLLPFAGAGIGYLRQSRRNFGDTYDFTSSIEAFPWRVATGASYLLSPHLAVDLTAEYNRGRILPDTNFFNAASSQRQVEIGVELRVFL